MQFIKYCKDSFISNNLSTRRTHFPFFISAPIKCRTNNIHKWVVWDWTNTFYLVGQLERELGNSEGIIVDASITWSTTLRRTVTHEKNVILDVMLANQSTNCHRGLKAYCKQCRNKSFGNAILLVDVDKYRSNLFPFICRRNNWISLFAYTITVHRYVWLNLCPHPHWNISLPEWFAQQAHFASS